MTPPLPLALLSRLAPSLVLPLTAAVIAAASPLALAQTEPPRLRPERLLGQNRAPLAAEGVSFARADRVLGDAQDELELEGNAEVRSRGAVLRGDRIIYTYGDDLLRVRGSARLFQGGVVFTGPSLDYKLEAMTGGMPDAQFSYAPSGASGRADELHFMGPEFTRMRGAEYTTCTPADRAWWVQAEQLDLDRTEEVAVARWARLYFQNVPIFASPYLEFPLGERRRSGVLTPVYGVNSRVGLDLTVPIYWDIAPNRDATIEPRLMARRGLMLQNQFRYLEPTFRGQVQVNHIANDRVLGQSRDFTSVQHSWNGRNGFSAGVNYNRVSDSQYFVDFSRTIVEGSTTVLPQEGYFGYAQTYWGAALRVNQNQTLIDPLAPVAKPYERVPQLAFGANRLDWHGFDVALPLELTRFDNSRSPFGAPLEPGTRILANPSVSYPVLAPGWFVVPRVQWHSTRYDLDSQFRPQQSQRTRDLPIVSVDSGLVFERDAHLFDRATTQTLEPRLFYTRIPYREQNDLPNFDSALADFNVAQLFQENVFVGGDRIAEANHMTAALVSRLLDRDSGAERLRAAVGQRFYYGRQRVALPGGAGLREERSSDVLLGINGAITREWLLDFATQYSTAQSQVVRATAGVRYQPRAASVLSLAYRYKLNELQQFDLAGQWPLTSRWYGVGRANYSQRENRWIETLAGLEYKADCWVLRLAASRFATATQTATTQVYIAIEFNGLGSVGTSPVETLRRNIPGYQLINPPPAQPGRFDVYE